MTQAASTITAKFSDLGIGPNLLAILTSHKYITPTPIQHQSIPIALEGKDMVGIAQTGTGKTLAFGIPMIQRLALHKGQGLIILPTRELALQVDETLQKIGRTIGLKTAVLIGGAPMGRQTEQIRRRPHVIIATPGRLIDHVQQKTMTLSSISILVLDEADRMFDMGFAPQLTQILKLVPKQRQTMLFSATMPPAIMKIASAHMSLPIRVEVAPAGTTSQGVEQEIFIVRQDSKLSLLEKLLKDNPGTVLVFSRTKHGAKKIARTVRDMGHSSAEIHSNRSLAQRKDALAGFKSGKYRILIATDIAARGIDVTGITIVINYDLPDNPEDYVHRIGRTGRAGHIGRAISFATPHEMHDVKTIERLIRKPIRVSKLPELPKEQRMFSNAPRPEFPPRPRGTRPTGQRPHPRFPNRNPRHPSR